MTPEQKAEWSKRLKAAHEAMKALNEYIPIVMADREPEPEEPDNIALFQDTEVVLSEILIWEEELS